MKAMTNAATELSKDANWRGWEFFTVTTRGGHDPTVVARSWTAQDVHDAYWDILLRGMIE